MTKVTAIIPSLYEKDHEYVELCVRSLRDTTDWDITVVTNGTPTPLPFPKGLPCRRLHTRDQGQCNAVNIGASVVSPTTDYLFIVNSDMYFAPGWNKYLQFNHLVFSPNLIEPIDNLGSAPPFLKADGGYTLEKFDKHLVDNAVTKYTSELVGKTEPGFNLPFFIRKDVWQTIGGYDVKYDPWGSNSDTDLQTLIEVAGVRPVRLRDVLVYHFSNKSGTFDGTHQAEWQRNFDYYRSKLGYTRDDEPKGDPWYATNMVNKDKLIFHPSWENKFSE